MLSGVWNSAFRIIFYIKLLIFRLLTSLSAQRTSNVALSAFITYAHDTEEHKVNVLTFANRLRMEGVEAVLDQFNSHPPEGWPKWMEKQFERADRIIMVPSDKYKQRYYQEDGIGSGARFEGAILTTMLMQSGVSYGRIAVACIDESSAQHIPRLLDGCERYNVYTERGYDDLYRWLTSQPAIVPAPVGQIRRLPPRSDFSSFTPSEPGNSAGRFALLCKAVEPIVQDNRRIFQAFGPNSGAGHDQPLRMDMSIWHNQRRAKILPNNARIREVVMAHRSSIPEEYSHLFDRLISHIDAYEVHVNEGGVDYREHQFPVEIDDVLKKHS